MNLRQAALLIDSWFPAGVETTGADTATSDAAVTPEADAPRREAKEASTLDEPQGKGTLPSRGEPTPAVNPPLEFTLPIDQTHPYLFERGLTPETIHEFGVGFCTSTRSMMKDRIVIPIHDWHPDTGDSNLVAYAGRWATSEPPDADTPKYLMPPNFHKLSVVYNLLSAQRYARDEGLVVVEGFFPVMRLWQVGIRTGVSLMGSVDSTQQEELIVSTAGACTGKVTLLFDPDEAGRSCRQDALARLCPQVHVRAVNIDTQPDDLSDAELRAVVTGS